VWKHLNAKCTRSCKRCLFSLVPLLPPNQTENGREKRPSDLYGSISVCKDCEQNRTCQRYNILIAVRTLDFVGQPGKHKRYTKLRTHEVPKNKRKKRLKLLTLPIRCRIFSTGKIERSTLMIDHTDKS